MLKFEIVIGSLQVSDGDVKIFVMPKESCAIDVLKLYDDIPFVEIFNKFLGNNTVIFSEPLSVCADSNGTPFTVNSFIAFSESNLG